MFAAADNLSEIYIGCAFINDEAMVKVADESVYRYFNKVYSFLIADFILDEYRNDFFTHLKNCTFEKDIFTLKCLRFDGAVRNAAFVMYKKVLGGSIYTAVEIFDIFLMSQKYLSSLSESLNCEKMLRLSENNFFLFDKANDNLTVYSKDGIIYDGAITKHHQNLLDEEKILPADEEQFALFTNALREANCEAFCSVYTKFFDTDGKDGYQRTFLHFIPLGLNSMPDYAIGSTSLRPYIDIFRLDPLTYLLNKSAIKTYALQALESAKASGGKVIFIIIDLDNFKGVNDTYGHVAGDRIIMNAARILKDIIGKKGAVGRIGGDEFLIVYSDPDGSIDFLVPLMRSIRTHLQTCFENMADDINVTGSIGVSRYPIDSDNYDDLFMIADHCLYQAKAKGRNRFVIYQKHMYSSLEEIRISGSVILPTNYVDESKKDDFLISVIARCNAAKTEAEGQNLAISIMREMLGYYDIDCIQYCGKSDDDPIFDVSLCNSVHPCHLRPIYEEYKDELALREYLAIGHYQNFEKKFPLIAEYMQKNAYESAMIVLSFGRTEAPAGIFALFMHRHPRIWSEHDKRTLPALCGILSRFM